MLRFVSCVRKLLFALYVKCFKHQIMDAVIDEYPDETDITLWDAIVDVGMETQAKEPGGNTLHKPHC